MWGREIVPGVYAVGVVDWDRRLFEDLMPIHQGTSYNAYLIKGSEKTALVDTVDPAKKDEFFSNLKKVGVERLDYIISNHTEQDHSGCIPDVLSAYPGAKVVTNTKCKELLMDHLHLSEDVFVVIQDEESLSLGDKTLVFKLAPWVHWPETMFTYLVEDKILFTCDFLGSHLATSELFAVEEERVYIGAKSYYAEIMMPFRDHVKRHLEKIEKLPLAYIAPSHGPVYHKPEFILQAYRDWSSDEVKNRAVLACVSMHDSTALMSEYLVEALVNRGITVDRFNLTYTELTNLSMALVDAATILLGTPTMLVGPHPFALSAAYLINVLRPKARLLGLYGSYGWGSRVVDIINQNLRLPQAKTLEPVLIKGLPRKEDFQKLDNLAEEVKRHHQEWGLLA
ncbi:MAG TPA: FprA family A-type flavoprotein [Moorella mulderi]|nr:FprA family A-type flavoprotein [Moorella mulderi]